MLEIVIENLLAFLGLCLVVGVVGLPVNFVLGRLNLINKELYQKIKFVCQMALIIGAGSAVTVAVIESFIDDFL